MVIFFVVFCLYLYFQEKKNTSESSTKIYWKCLLGQVPIIITSSILNHPPPRGYRCKHYLRQCRYQVTSFSLGFKWDPTHSPGFLCLCVLRPSQALHRSVMEKGLLISHPRVSCSTVSSPSAPHAPTYPTTMSLGPATTVQIPSSQCFPTRLWACRWIFFPFVTNWTITFAGPT